MSTTSATGATVRTPDVDFLLPGEWWHVPLTTDEVITRSARGLAVATFGRADDRARLRGELAADVRRAAVTARDGDCHDFWFAVELAPGERVPLSLTSAFPVLDEAPSRAAAGRVAAEVMAAQLVLGAPHDDVEVVEDDDHGVVRVTRVVPHVEVDGQVTELGRLSVTYWVLKQHARRALVLSFTTPLVEAREELTFLADAIVASVRWPD